ncbi:hypothetical protein K488DRAFT_82221 [Vararia minispora EC-137]|uniref:Uncharacterized protein n=1 Tax=Vararia minispora EC-137 TaxID=1314806 RepID=A0ACB8QWU5_9AGAM|nr:hypothetical protein K488DRAFT_82221 [Vararia minispora EC-137]
MPLDFLPAEVFVQSLRGPFIHSFSNKPNRSSAKPFREDFTQRLPAEILSLIFIVTALHHEDELRSPWQSLISVRVSLVCSRWRAIALGLSELWSQIHLHWPLGLAELYYERAGSNASLSFYFSEDHIGLRSFNAQAGLLLDCNIPDLLPSLVSNIVANIKEGDAARSRFLQTWAVTPVKLLAYPDILSRTRVVHIAMYTPSYQTARSLGARIGSVTQAIVKAAPLPMLESLTLRLLDARGSPLKSSYCAGDAFRANGLRRLVLASLSIFDAAAVDRCAFFPPSLTSLSLCNTHINHAGLDLAFLLCGLIHLEDLTLSKIAGLAPTLPTDAPSIALPRLRRFTLDVGHALGTALLEAMALPHRVEVDITLSLAPKPGAPPFVRPLAALQQLFPPLPAHFRALAIDGLTFTLSAPSDACALPSRLTAHFVDYPSAWPDFWLFVQYIILRLPACTAITHLAVGPHAAFEHEQDGVNIWMRGLAQVPALRAVEVIDTRGVAGARLLAALLRAGPDAESIAFPGLRRLAVQLDDAVEWSGPGMKLGVRKIRERRPLVDIGMDVGRA